MTTKTKFIIGLLVLFVGATGYTLLGNSDQLTGRLDKQIAFFKDAPIKDKVIQGSFITYKEAVGIFADASLQANLITQKEAQKYIQYYSSENVITRQDLAAMAVLLFKLHYKNEAPEISDLPENPSYRLAILTCVANGCTELNSGLYKPTNNATREFAIKVASNLTAQAR